MEFIRTQELDYLLRHLNELHVLLENFKKQIENIKNDKGDDLIYACMTNRNMDGLPGTRRISDRTAITALNLRGISGERRGAFQEVRAEINQIGMVIDKLEMAKRRLSHEEQTIINYRYQREKTLQEISSLMKCSKAKIQKNIGQALERMCQACRIEQDEYTKVLKILERMMF